MAAVLHGLRVIDFGQYIAGPLAAMLLADQGANVMRIDPPGGPRWNTPANAIWNRGKRSIVLDLDQAQDLKLAHELIASADIVIENFRSGVMTRLGLDADQLTSAFPHLIWCALPGFASDDPRAAMPAWEGILGAATGNFTLNVQALRDDAGRRLPQQPDDRPIYTITPVSSVYAAFFAAASIAMALIARQRDGRGQRIEVPLFDATFSAIGSPRWAGIPGTPWTRSYECADGRWIDMICYHAKFIRAFVKAAGVEHWLNESFIGNIERPFRTEPKQAATLLQRMETLFGTRTALEWETTLNAGGVPVAVCRTCAEWLALPQALASKAIVEVNDPSYGSMRQPGVQVRLSDTPGAITTPAPTPDQHRIEILTELKQLPPRSAATVAPDSRAPLAGIRVIDLGTVLVGPACGRTLAEFGAEVIKIDDPAGFGPGVDVGRGKRSMLLDLRKPEGRETLARLADRCDVFLENFRMGVAENLGIGYQQLRDRNPGVVYVSFTLYGREGPWARRPGYENQAQAATGMMDRFGDGCPAMEPFPVSDYGTAIMGSYAVALALYYRTKLRQRGELARGQHVDTALVYTTSMLQSPVLHKHPDTTEYEPRGQHMLGSSALHRCYQAKDGWLFVGAEKAQIAALDAVSGLEGIAQLTNDEQQAIFLEICFKLASVAEWVARLEVAGLGAHKVTTIAEVMADPWVRAKGLYLERDHPDGGTVTTIGPIPRLSRTPLQPGRALRPSMDAKEILAEVQLDGKLEQLLADGVVVIRPPRK